MQRGLKRRELAFGSGNVLGDGRAETVETGAPARGSLAGGGSGVTGVVVRGGDTGSGGAALAASADGKVSSSSGEENAGWTGRALTGSGGKASDNSLDTKPDSAGGVRT